VTGERGGALSGIERRMQVIRAVQTAQAVSGRDRQRSCWRATVRRSFASGQPCVKANADRGGSLARRRIHGSRACPRVEHALQRSVSAIAAQRSPFETPTTGFRSARRSPAPAACESRVGQRTGRRGLRSRVNLSDGIARCPPERSRRRSDCRSDHSVDVHGEHPGRKAWVGIDQALGSPSVLPKEDSPDRPLVLLFTEEGQRRSWLERPEA
jgi:hypothetical protein